MELARAAPAEGFKLPSWWRLGRAGPAGLHRDHDACRQRSITVALRGARPRTGAPFLATRRRGAALYGHQLCRRATGPTSRAASAPCSTRSTSSRASPTRWTRPFLINIITNGRTPRRATQSSSRCRPRAATPASPTRTSRTWPPSSSSRTRPAQAGRLLPGELAKRTILWVSDRDHRHGVHHVPAGPVQHAVDRPPRRGATQVSEPPGADPSRRRRCPTPAGLRPAS